MELRRPTLADKETILNMMTEFEETQSAHDGGFWDAENFDYEEWLETNLNKEMGIGLPVILANGGQFEDVQNGTERYWIEVE